MDASERLTKLYVKLYRREAADLPASDEELVGLWQACEKPVILLMLMAPMLSRQDLVLATSACVRLLAGPALAEVPEAINAMETAENWARGQASSEEAYAACEAALEAGERYSVSMETSSDLAYACASIAYLPNVSDYHEDLSKAVGYVRKDAWAYRNAAHADEIRALLPVPILTRLRSIYPSGQ